MAGQRLLGYLSFLLHLVYEPVQHTVDEGAALLAEELGNLHIFVDGDADRNFREALGLGETQHDEGYVNAVEPVGRPSLQSLADAGEISLIPCERILQQPSDELAVTLQVGSRLLFPEHVALVELRQPPLLSGSQILQCMAAECQRIGNVIRPVNRLVLKNSMKLGVVSNTASMQVRAVARNQMADTISFDQRCSSTLTGRVNIR